MTAALQIPSVFVSRSSVLFKTDRPASMTTTDASCMFSQTITSAKIHENKLRLNHNVQVYFPHPQIEQGMASFISKESALIFNKTSDHLSDLSVTFEFPIAIKKAVDLTQVAVDSFFGHAKISEGLGGSKHLEALLVVRVFQRTIFNAFNEGEVIALNCLSASLDHKVPPESYRACSALNLHEEKDMTSFKGSLSTPVSDVNPAWSCQDFIMKIFASV